ncbi:N-6 DNA methylase, partial [Klebsiella pneumoniae]|nr:N-6 DNA methylase [Klebsiella pneumoniae]
APNDLLTSPQSDLLKGWLQEQANIVAMIALPPNLFGKTAMAKSIFVLQKKAARSLTPFVYPLQSLQEPEAIQKFMLNFKNWKQENAI